MTEIAKHIELLELMAKKSNITTIITIKKHTTSIKINGQIFISETFENAFEKVVAFIGETFENAFEKVVAKK